MGSYQNRIVHIACLLSRILDDLIPIMSLKQSKRIEHGFRLIRIKHLDTVIVIIHHHACGRIKREPYADGVSGWTDNGPCVHSVLAGLLVT